MKLQVQVLVLDDGYVTVIALIMSVILCPTYSLRTFKKLQTFL